jgi:FkbM family methyltransferase
MRVAEVETAVGVLKVGVFNDVCEWRANTFHTKEPDTVRWLDRLGPGDILWDVGANIGLYSCYAAMRGAHVYAFEPLLGNVFALQANVGMNGLDARVDYMPVAVGSREELATLYCSEPGVGSSCHSAGLEVSPSLERKESRSRQPVLIHRAHFLHYQCNIPAPTDVKIDVDGLEHLVVMGFGTMKPRSWIIETNWNLVEHRHMIERLQHDGYVYDEEQYANAQRKDGPFKGTGEMILTRV